jgi:succinate dehydrogenase / fumarate reductase cytochrome b subunit
MSEVDKPRIPSILKKVLMALTGLVWVGYVAGHMAGNLQFFMPPEAINGYAFFLHHDLPPAALWGIRVFLLAALGVHVWMAVLLTLENKRARPQNYDVDDVVQASIFSRTMRFSGGLVLLFFVVHILHFTIRALDPLHSRLTVTIEGIQTQDVYGMMAAGFSNIGMSLFYILVLGLLCMHLAHGVSSMFQSVGLRNKVWRGRLDKLALAYGVVIFVGFASIPAAVLLSWHGDVPIGQIHEVRDTIQAMEGTDGDIFIPYEGSGETLAGELPKTD